MHNPATTQTNLQQPINLIQFKQQLIASNLSEAAVANGFSIKQYWDLGQLISRLMRLQDWSMIEKKTFKEWLVGELHQLMGVKMTIRKVEELIRFYEKLPDQRMLFPDLKWSHYVQIIKIERPVKRWYYLEEAAAGHWSAAQLRRQIRTRCYRRLKQEPYVYADEQKMMDRGIEAHLKDPYIFEFISNVKHKKHTEKILLDGLTNRMNDLLLEFGRGYTFVALQQRLATVSGKQFYVDLVFYHYLLKRFILVDLKTSELTHGDIGQMDMYIRLFEDRWRGADDQPTIGLILCPKKDPAILKYSIAEQGERLFVSTYKTGNNAGENL